MGGGLNIRGGYYSGFYSVVFRFAVQDSAGPSVVSGSGHVLCIPIVVYSNRIYSEQLGS